MVRKSLSPKNKLLPKLQVSAEVLMDAEQIAIGGYAPLKGFMSRANFEAILNKMCLTNGEVWTLPVTLDVKKKEAASFKVGQEIILVDQTQQPSALFRLEEIYPHNKSLRCQAAYGTEDISHPGVAKVLAMGDVLFGGEVVELFRGINFPLREVMLCPKETKAYFEQKGWQSVAAFHTRNVAHRAHEYLQRCAMEYVDGLLIHPVFGSTKAGDFKKELIIQAYRKLIDAYYPKDKVLLASLGIGMQFAGPREAVFHALVRKNYGCTHIIIGRNHAGVGGFYDKYAAHRIFSELPELGITPLLFKGPFYCQRCDGIATESTCGHDEADKLEVSGTLVRKLVKEGKKLPGWLIRPEIADLLEGLGEGAFSSA